MSLFSGVSQRMIELFKQCHFELNLIKIWQQWQSKIYDIYQRLTFGNNARANFADESKLVKSVSSIVAAGTMYVIRWMMTPMERARFAENKAKIYNNGLGQCFPTFFGLQHPYLVFKIIGGTSSLFNRYKYQGIVITSGTPDTSTWRGTLVWRATPVGDSLDLVA